MNEMLLLWMIGIPAAAAALTFLTPAKGKAFNGLWLILGTLGNLIVNIMAAGKELTLKTAWCGFNMDFSLKLYHFSGFIVLAAAAIGFLVSVYTVSFSKGKTYNTKLLYGCMLLTLSMVNGAVTANNLMVMLFFWEAILATMFGMIMVGGKDAYKTSIKAVVIAGVTDLCMMLGIGLAGYIAGTLAMDQMRIPLEGWGLVAFILLLIGALSKAGAMPFHTWIPDAANDAPMPFMAFLPGALEKLLGVYLLSRLCIDLFDFQHGSPMSMALMILGTVTILLAVLMALIQRDFKRLLSYHAVSQVGYIILGIGTGLPVGIVGGLFHMINNAVYKCCLFLTAGAVEKETGTSNLNILGGLGKKMPITFACFTICALSIAGFPMTNGFFSKELIFDGAIESGMIFYIMAAIGAFFTPVSFLKLGHAVFLGKPTEATKDAKEAPLPMLIPMIVLAATCLIMGFGKSFVIGNILQPILGHAEAGHVIGEHTNWVLVGISAALLGLAVLDHWLGFRRTGKGIESADHYHHAPVLKQAYDLAEKKVFDPYEQSRGWLNAYATVSLKINDGISYFYDVVLVKLVKWLSSLVKGAHNGSQSRYVTWVIGGVVIVAAIFLGSWYGGV